ncbi:MAG: hypothetical protein HRT43_10580, partial [Campylobacteraceae bacterium]|nr:hypothetical protein [Campylobacteraceae bacterium]
MKKIAIIPPNGKLNIHDFVIYRLSQYLSNKNFSVYLIKIDEESDQETLGFFEEIVNVKDINEIIDFLEKKSFDLIIHRCWMHAYPFAAILAPIFKNIIFYIKDWMQEISQEEYKLVYNTEDDYPAIRLLFASNKKILSHYSPEYVNKVWVEEYDIEKNNFIFFPEYTDTSKHFIRNNTSFEKNNIKLLSLGRLGPTCHPKNISNNQLFLENIKLITSQQIHFHKMILKQTYNNVMKSPLYLDYIYEDTINEYFNIIKGSEFNSNQLQDYHFGVYQLLDCEEYNTKDSKSVLNAVVSKLVNYLEAGLPILVNKAYYYVPEIVSRYDIGIVISNEEVKSLQVKLNISQERYSQLVENVYKFRNEYSYNDITMKP